MFLRTAFAVTLSAIVPFLVILTLCEPNWWTQPIFTSYFENILLTRNNDATNLLLLLCVKYVTISYSAFYDLSLTLHDSNKVHPLYILGNKSVLPICQKVNVHWTFENARLCWMKQAFFFFFVVGTEKLIIWETVHNVWARDMYNFPPDPVCLHVQTRWVLFMPCLHLKSSVLSFVSSAFTMDWINGH